MHQLTYMSTAKPGLTLADVESILAAAWHRNATEGLSGRLLFDGVRFLHVIEGARAPVLAAFERIRLDERHHAVVLLASREIDSREFGDRGMALDHVDPVAEDEAITRAVNALVPFADAKGIRDLFSRFRRLNRKVA